MRNNNELSYKFYGTSFDRLYCHEQEKIEEYAEKENSATKDDLNKILTIQPCMMRPKISDKMPYNSYQIIPTRANPVWVKEINKWTIAHIFHINFRSLRHAKVFIKTHGINYE